MVGFLIPDWQPDCPGHPHSASEVTHLATLGQKRPRPATRVITNGTRSGVSFLCAADGADDNAGGSGANTV